MAKNGFVSAMDNLPWILKIILCLPILDIVWGVYRIVKGVSTNKVLTWVFGILWIIPGCAICWIVDLICTIIFRKPRIFA